MKKIIIPKILLICIAIFFASCGGETKAQNNLYLSLPATGNNGTCHTILAPESLATSTVAKEDVINTGQFVTGVVKDHAQKFHGYTKEMFLLDNPEIAKRPQVKKLDPCDSTKVKYVSIPLYPGDIILLRLPWKVDTIPGYAESIVYKPAIPSSHIKKILDIDDKGRVVVEYQNIYCNGIIYNPYPPQPGVIPPVNAIPPGDRINIPPSDTVTPPTVGDGAGDRLGGGNGYSKEETPWWVWLMLVLLIVGIAMIFKVMRQKQANPDSVGSITEAVRAEGRQTRDHVTAAMDGLGGKMDTQTAATKEQTKASNTTNDLLQKWLNQQGVQ